MQNILKVAHTIGELMSDKSFPIDSQKKLKELYSPYKISDPFPKDQLPYPIFDQNPEFVNLYWTAWELAWDHILEQENMPVKRYMDEAMIPSQIWIWDTCFMALFARYGFHVFPGIQSLDNFYGLLYDETSFKSPAKIHFSDNPPLFAWIESEYLKLSGDIDRIHHILGKKQYLQKHFYYMQNAKKRPKPRNVMVFPVAYFDGKGYRWRGNTSGMDNTPRGRTWWNNSKLNQRGQIANNRIYWVDLLAQQALAAKNIADLAVLIDDDTTVEVFTDQYKNHVSLLDDYWSKPDHFYFDINIGKTSILDKYNKVPTIASFWPLLAEGADESQANYMSLAATNPREFGGTFPWVSLSHSDPEFHPLGRYWRGGIWLPTAYMATKSLDKYGYYEITHHNSMALLKQMEKTFSGFEPHTIWECYSPTTYHPSTQKKNERYVRPDFCGWSALGPISLFIEDVLGFHEINSIKNFISWNLRPELGDHGIKNLHFGKNNVDLLYSEDLITTKAKNSYLLEINLGKKTIQTEIPVGDFSFTLSDIEKDKKG